jgi:hypothetical protein
MKYFDTMNSSKGIIFGTELPTEGVEELKKNSANVGELEIKRIERFTNGAMKATGMHIVTFNTYTLPVNAKIGYIRYEVRTLYPSPLRCVKCLTYGHTKNHCPEKTNIARSVVKSAIQMCLVMLSNAEMPKSSTSNSPYIIGPRLPSKNKRKDNYRNKNKQ